VPLLGERCVVSGRELASAPPTGLTAASEALGLASGGGAHTAQLGRNASLTCAQDHART